MAYPGRYRASAVSISAIGCDDVRLAMPTSIPSSAPLKEIALAEGIDRPAQDFLGGLASVNKRAHQAAAGGALGTLVSLTTAYWIVVKKVKKDAAPEHVCADNVTFLKDNPSSRARTASPSPARPRRTWMTFYAADGPGDVEAVKCQIARRPR
ncbi:MAG: hypothetical protein ACREXX_02100 [Gammaproteobacteria bacterium]